MSVSVLNQIEEMVSHLSQQERLVLIERLAHALRQDSENETAGSDVQTEALRLERNGVAAEIAREALPPNEAELRQARMTAAWNEAMRQMGISGEPIGAEELQHRIAASGVNPEENIFSRGIIEMREE